MGQDRIIPGSNDQWVDHNAEGPKEIKRTDGMILPGDAAEYIIKKANNDPKFQQWMREHGLKGQVSDFEAEAAMSVGTQIGPNNNATRGDIIEAQTITIGRIAWDEFRRTGNTQFNAGELIKDYLQQVATYPSQYALNYDAKIIEVQSKQISGIPQSVRDSRDR